MSEIEPAISIADLHAIAIMCRRQNRDKLKVSCELRVIEAASPMDETLLSIDIKSNRLPGLEFKTNIAISLCLFGIGILDCAERMIKNHLIYHDFPFIEDPQKLSSVENIDDPGNA